MSRWILRGAPEWRSLFTSYSRSAYRLECQQLYSSAAMDADLTNFLSGRPVEVDWTYLRESLAVQHAKGAVKTKVRVVVEPQTQYTQLEMTLYPTMAEIGEDIRILVVQQGDWPDGVPHHDYWLFDDRDLWRMHYHENFHFKGAEQITDEAVIEEHRQARDAALAQAVPLGDYRHRHPEIEEHRTA